MPVIPTLGSLTCAMPQTVANYPSRSVAGIDVVDLPGGLFVMGHRLSLTAPARWVRLSGFSMGRTPVRDDEGYPVVDISALEAGKFIARFNAENGTRFGFPTEAEWEYAARGEVVDLRARMETEGIKEADFVRWVEGRFENFFAHCLGSTIYTDPRRPHFQKVLKSASSIYGYCVFGHPEGLRDGKVWYNRDKIASVVGEAAEKRANSFNLIDMIGNVYEWVADKYRADAYRTLSPINPVNQNGKFQIFCGGSGFSDHYEFGLRAGSRGSYCSPNRYRQDLGFRMALPGL